MAVALSHCQCHGGTAPAPAQFNMTVHSLLDGSGLTLSLPTSPSTLCRRLMSSRTDHWSVAEPSAVLLSDPARLVTTRASNHMVRDCSLQAVHIAGGPKAGQSQSLCATVSPCACCVAMSTPCSVLSCPHPMACRLSSLVRSCCSDMLLRSSAKKSWVPGWQHLLPESGRARERWTPLHGRRHTMTRSGDSCAHMNSMQQTWPGWRPWIRRLRSLRSRWRPRGQPPQHRTLLQTELC